MSAEVRNLYVVLGAQTSGFRGQMVGAGAMVRQFGSDVVSMSDKSAAAVDDLGRRSGRAAVGAAAGLGLISKAAVDWQSDFAGVQKTVDGTTTQINQLEDELREMARTMPATHTEIAATAEAAGQLGVATEDIADFTRVMVMMGETTNVTSEDAATSIAQFMNVLQSADADVDQIANTIVALGNKGASTEAQILDMATRTSGAGSLLNASEADVLGLSAAMANLGIQSELGGGAIQRTAIIVNSAVLDQGEKLERFAELAGMSAQDFAAQWQSDPMRAIDGLVQGMGRIQASGGNVTSTLADLGIKGTQNLQVLLRLAGSGDMLSKSLDQANDAWGENSALQEEYGKRAETDASKIQVAWNQIKDAAIDAGGVALPVIADITKVVGTMADAFGGLPDPVQDAFVGLLAVTAVLGGSAWFGTKVVGGIRDTRNSLAQLRGENTRTTRGLTATRSSLQGVVADLRAVAAGWLTTGTTASGQAAKMQAATARARLATAGVRTAGAIGGTALLATGAADGAGINNTLSLAMLGSAVLPGYGTALGAVAGLTMDLAGANNDLEASYDAVDEALSRGVSGLADARAQIAANRQEIAGLAESWTWAGDSFGEGVGEVLKASVNPQFWSELFGDKLGGDIERTNEQLQAVTDQEDALYRVGLAMGKVFETNPDGTRVLALEELTEVAERAQPALDALGYTWEELSAMDWKGQEAAGAEIQAWLSNADTAAGKTDALAASLVGLEDEMSTVEDRAGNLKDAMDQLFGSNLGLSAATDQWQQGLRSLNEDLAENSRQLQGQTAGAAENRDVIRGRIEDIQALLNAMAEDGAAPEKIAKTLSRSREELVAWGVEAGLSEQQLRGFIREMGLTPKSVSTIFEALGIDEAEAETRTLVEAYNRLPRNVRTFVKQNGAMDSVTLMDQLIAKYGLTPDQVVTVLEARDNASVTLDGVKAKIGVVDRSNANPTVSVQDAASGTIAGILGGLRAIAGLWSATVTVNRVNAPGGREPDENGDVAPPTPERGFGGGRGRYRGGRYGSTPAGSGGRGVTVVQQRLPDRVTLDVGGAQFTAFVRAHANDVAVGVADAGASSRDATDRMGWN